ncbi:transcriptional regulator GutM [Thermogemmatispora sp.]|uniref:transcriptional regulator GutM n=1 Tax=Thermogemmatispora sp. TaxID=1968838 RepID=UPI001DEAC8B9|nr:transcriptional regulator GutM [Thermogemmatispora sp.]MBX5451635.1 transcriptional regulator GutM [Thermogemmatispora sp.]
MIEQVALAALVAWCLQLALAYGQARRFYRDVSRLRRLGRCATAMAGGRYRGRTYVVLVAHPEQRTILAARYLSGWTVFARLRPLPQLEGRPLDELLSAQQLSTTGLAPRLVEAINIAAGTLHERFQQQSRETVGAASQESMLPPRTSLQPLA